MIGEEVIAYYGDAGDGAELFEVQKLVRCKECKYWQEYKDEDFCNNEYGLYGDTRADDFCSYGERSEE